jgi:nucleoside-diphosphate-sugar epimerase
MLAEISKDFWQGKKVLVTGAAGFIGSHLCESLVKVGGSVKAFIRYNSRGSCGLMQWIPTEIRELIEIFDGDILDEGSILNAMKDTEIVFHLAALPGIPYSFRNPRHVFLVNTFGTFNVLSAARTCGADQVLLASSAGASEKRPLVSPYVATKAAMEKIGQGFHQGLDQKVSIIRFMNNYGPRQSARAIIPTIISQALVRDDVHLGSLEPRMDFNFISDSICALLKAAENPDVSGKTLTWGTESSISIKDLAEVIFSLIGRKGLSIVTDKQRLRPYYGAMPSLDEEISATHRLLNYTPKINLQEGLQKTIEWISQNITQYRTDKYLV